MVTSRLDTAPGRSSQCSSCRNQPPPCTLPTHPRTSPRDLEWTERKMPGGMAIPSPTKELGSVPLPPYRYRFSFGRWLLYLLLPVLCYGVGGTIPTPQRLYGEVTSPLFPKPYPNNFERTTVITVPTGYRVKLVFWQFDLEPSEGCFYDYVKVGGQTRGVGRGRTECLWNLGTRVLTGLDSTPCLGTQPQAGKS